MRYIFLFLFGLIISSNLYSQIETENSEETEIPDSTLVLSPSAASEYITQLIENEQLWSATGDTMRLSLSRLLGHYSEPFDSVQSRLSAFQYDSVKTKEVQLIKRDTLYLKWLNDSTFIKDSPDLERSPLIRQTTIFQAINDTVLVQEEDNVHELDVYGDPLFFRQDTSGIKTDFLQNRRRVDSINRNKTGLVGTDTVTVVTIDSSYLRIKNIQLYNISNNFITPPLFSSSEDKSYWFLPDSTRLIIATRTRATVAEGDSPFYIVTGTYMPDSLKVAVQTLLDFTNRRDSILLYLNDINGRRTPFWLTTGDDELYRYWVKNYRNDSITIWMGNPSKNDLTFTLEQGVNLERLKKVIVDDIPIARVRPELKLVGMKPLKEIPVYWDYSFSNSFSLNQTYLSNWSKGGENSFSSLLDMQGTATYNDKKAKTEWTNNARIKFGTLITEEFGLRTNADIFEINSQYNKKLKEKLDFSTIFYMKNQLARGYNYPNDSVVISKFLNPGTFTIGVGLEYKPFKKTSLNLSPLSYKNTFVLDTANIDQTLHGIASNKRSRQEMGGQLLVKNSFSLMKDLDISNKVRLFSGYLNHPENIDVDWEIEIEKKLSYYFTIMLNLHMIYDDDVLFPVLDEDNEPVILPDGSVYKVPKLQFKQFLGLSFLFKF